MPTIQQLIRYKRKNRAKKCKTPALLTVYNSFKHKEKYSPSPLKRGVCTRVATMTPKNLILLLENMQKSV